MTMGEVMDEPAGPLESEIQELEHAVVHLVRSNDELVQAIAEQGPDRDYQEAINDNIVTIARHRARIASLKEQLRAMHHGAMGDVHTAEVSGAADNAAAGTWL